MADVDHFKRTNDTFGHRAGDEVLAEIGRRLRSAVRSYDAVGRYGGEEFLIVLAGCGLRDSAARAEELRRSICERQFELDGRPIRLTVSLGVVAATEPALSTGECLIREADKALYAAKRAGRNRVAVAPARDPSAEPSPAAGLPSAPA